MNGRRSKMILLVARVVSVGLTIRGRKMTQTTLIESVMREAGSERTSQRSEILKRFQNQKFVSTSTLRALAYQYNARIYELRKLGYIIKRSKEKGRCGFEYKGKEGDEE